MTERTFFRGQSVSKILGVDHVIERGQIVDLSIRKAMKYDGKPNKIRRISTVLILIKTGGFRSSEKIRLGLLNRPFGFQPKISSVFPKNLR